jgi:hypothetical protein
MPIANMGGGGGLGGGGGGGGGTMSYSLKPFVNTDKPVVAGHQFFWCIGAKLEADIGQVPQSRSIPY